MYLYRVVRKALSDKKSFQQRPEESEGRSLAGILEKGIPGSGDSEVKGPELGICLNIQGQRSWIDPEVTTIFAYIFLLKVL